MSITGSIVTFVMIWWVVLFTVLPWGIQSQLETDDVEPGSEPGAPTAPRLSRKLLITTGITFVLWLIAQAVVPPFLTPP